MGHQDFREINPNLSYILQPTSYCFHEKWKWIPPSLEENDVIFPYFQIQIPICLCSRFNKSRSRIISYNWKKKHSKGQKSYQKCPIQFVKKIVKMVIILKIWTFLAVKKTFQTVKRLSSYNGALFGSHLLSNLLCPFLGNIKKSTRNYFFFASNFLFVQY